MSAFDLVQLERRRRVDRATFLIQQADIVEETVILQKAQVREIGKQQCQLVDGDSFDEPTSSIDTESCSIASNEFAAHSKCDNFGVDCQTDLASQDGHCVLDKIRIIEKENRQLREALQRSQIAVSQIHCNLYCKMTRMEQENIYLNKQLSEELATNSKLIVENRLLRKQVQNLKSQESGMRTGGLSYFEYDQDIEKQLTLLLHRYKTALEEVSTLKNMLIDACEPCRQRCLETKRPLSVRAENLGEKKRPTFRTSARCFLEKIPNQLSVPASKQDALDHKLLVPTSIRFLVHAHGALLSNKGQILDRTNPMNEAFPLHNCTNKQRRVVRPATIRKYLILN
jgi:hypothetical protein